ncbi:hypothetical protein BGW80DRAFT_1460389 [Lactifluus volemus]|nr:hypothetical protein BGW80DRAFT_1460389 [Lactifluus volemus]
MSKERIQDDLEHGPQPSLPRAVPSRSITLAVDGSPIPRRVSSRSATFDVSSIPRGTSLPQHAQTDDDDTGVKEDASPDVGDAIPGARASMNNRMNGQPRRDTYSFQPPPYGNPSAKIWGLYLSRAEKTDKGVLETWSDITNGVLVLAGLFSATVAAFITILSFPLLQRNPTDSTNLLLTQISQQLAALSNGTTLSTQLIASISDQSSFKPTASAVRVNVLWFVSLALTTLSALWATLMQQWSRRYVLAADRPYAPQNRARLRMFFAEGVEKFGLGAAVKMLPAFLHLSFLVFYVGLVEFLFPINRIVAYCLLAVVIIGLALYVVLSIMPLCYPESPYQTPLSSFLWFVKASAPLVKDWFRRKADVMRERRMNISLGMRRGLERAAFGLNWARDARALRWTLISLDGDYELEEEFLNALPGAFKDSPSQHYSIGLGKRMHRSINKVTHELLITCSSNLLPEHIRRQRLAACLGAIWCFPETAKRHCDAIWGQWPEITNDPWAQVSTEAWTNAVNSVTDSNPLIAFHAHCVQAIIAAMWCSGRWLCPKFEASLLLQRQLDASCVVMREYLTGNRDHLQLAVAANLLSNALQLLSRMEAGSDVLHLKAVMDVICDGLDVSDVPGDLKARFVDRAEVMTAYDPVQDVAPDSHHRHCALDLDGAWTKVFRSGHTQYESTIVERSL